MSDLLAPFIPTSVTPWDRRRATHLLRRAGFAPTEQEVRDAMEAGPGATVDHLLASREETARFEELDRIGVSAARRGTGSLRGWALLRMVATAHPLHARIAMMWHNHFATSDAKVNDPMLMLGQYRLFERAGLGSFRTLLDGVARDPAMLIWLDGNANVRGRPNENFARELLELFTLGIGEYSETDVRETARAFTGWQQRDGRFRFLERSHDPGEKRILGAVGQWRGEDAMRIALGHPACARFIARRLLREFVCPEPPAPLIDALAARLHETGFVIGETLRMLLKSRAMFDDRWYRARIKSPIELMVGMARSMALGPSGSDLEATTSTMGHALFEPPSVAGWDGHRAWLNAATMLARMNAGLRAASEVDPEEAPKSFGEPPTKQFWNRLLLDDVVPDALATDARTDVSEHLSLVLTSPEYQMA